MCVSIAYVSFNPSDFKICKSRSIVSITGSINTASFLSGQDIKYVYVQDSFQIIA